MKARQPVRRAGGAQRRRRTSVAAPLLEICCGGLDDALAAARGGADRVELCSAPFLGGLTPSVGTIVEATALLSIPLMVMVRPRGGGFGYSAAAFASMERDVELAVEAGADGVVFGVLRSDGTVDTKRTARLVKRAGGAQTVFHRAFDVTPDPLAALVALIEVGVTRILTSGQQRRAPDGVALIRRLRDLADGAIEILPGGGITPANVASVLAATGCDQVHLSAWRTARDTSTDAHPDVTFGGSLQPPEDRYRVTDAGLVAEVRARLRQP